jgi:hypothetical protein
MADGLKPTREQLLKHHVLGHCAQHLTWATAKKKASKHVDTKVFNRNLGPALDSLRDICDGAMDVKKYYNQLDDRTLKPVRERKAKVEKIINEYLAICKRELAKPGLTADQKKAWGDLATQLQTTAAAPANMTRQVLRG